MRYAAFIILVLLASTTGLSQSNIEVGKEAPEIHITDWIANVPTNQDLSNKNIVLEFWATWCGPCIAAVPHMNELQEEFNNEDLYYISITDEEVSKVKRTMKRVDFQSIVVSDQTEKTHIAYGDGIEGLEAYPLTVLISKSGLVQWIGEPIKLNSQVMTAFLEGNLIPSEQSSTISSETGVKPDTQEKLSFRDLMMDRDLKYYFDLEEVEVEGHSSQTMGSKIVRMMGYTIEDIYSEVFGIRKQQVNLPPDLADKKFLLLYKNTRSEEGLQSLERDILKQLSLQKTTKIRPSPAYIVKISDTGKGKLEETLSPNMSGTSDAGDKVIFTGKTINKMLEDISQNSDIPYRFDQNDSKKYDFIIQTNSQEAIMESLRSYGLEIVKVDLDTEYITLDYK